MLFLFFPQKRGWTFVKDPIPPQLGVVEIAASYFLPLEPAPDIGTWEVANQVSPEWGLTDPV